MNTMVAKITTINTIAELADFLDKYDDCGTYGLRGLSQHDIEQGFSTGDYMDPSFDLCDRRDCDYDEEAERLIGTSALGINWSMGDDKLMEVYNDALGYAQNHHDTNTVYLVYGYYDEYGEDPGERILYNEDCLQYVGAKVIAQVII